MKRRVTFPASTNTLVGNLHLPPDFHETGSYPAVIVQGSLTSVKEQMSGLYAERLADQGIVALAFDYSHYGESDGEPRQYESPEQKLTDLNAAVAYLAGLPYVRAVGMLGVCTSGGNVPYLAARNPQLKAGATVAAWLAEPGVSDTMLYGGAAGVEKLRQAGVRAAERYAATGENELIQAYSNVNASASHLGPMEYYMDQARGGGVPQWLNALAVQSWGNWLDFNPMGQATQVRIPMLIVHSDGCALPDQARKFHALLAGPKELYWAEGNHFDFYDQPAQVAEAVGKVSSFFKEHLN
jgi:fermentation-respiration switch protein FrsA (DUF1100 family)